MTIVVVCRPTPWICSDYWFRLIWRDKRNGSMTDEGWLVPLGLTLALGAAFLMRGDADPEGITPGSTLGRKGSGVWGGISWWDGWNQSLFDGVVPRAGWEANGSTVWKGSTSTAGIGDVAKGTIGTEEGASEDGWFDSSSWVLALNWSKLAEKKNGKQGDVCTEKHLPKDADGLAVADTSRLENRASPLLFIDARRAFLPGWFLLFDFMLQLAEFLTQLLYRKRSADDILIVERDMFRLTSICVWYSLHWSAMELICSSIWLLSCFMFSICVSQIFIWSVSRFIEPSRGDAIPSIIDRRSLLNSFDCCSWLTDESKDSRSACAEFDWSSKSFRSCSMLSRRWRSVSIFRWMSAKDSSIVWIIVLVCSTFVTQVRIVSSILCRSNSSAFSRDFKSLICSCKRDFWLESSCSRCRSHSNRFLRSNSLRAA